MEPYVITAVITLGTAYGGVKAAQNGIYKILDRIQAGNERNATVLQDHGERLVRIETKLED